MKEGTLTKEEELKLDDKLADHLQYKTTPPVSLSMMDICKDAIFNCFNDEHNKTVKVGESEVASHEVVEHIHLEWFVDRWPFFD